MRPASLLAVRFSGTSETDTRSPAQAPLEPKNTNVIALGYKRSSEADHIWRDIAQVGCESSFRCSAQSAPRSLRRESTQHLCPSVVRSLIHDLGPRGRRALPL